MPGKVNPVMPEMLLMICAQVVGNDAAIGWGGAAGNFELNVMIPVMAYNLLHSINILANGCRLFASRCIEGIEPNEERCAALIEQSLAMVTGLNEAIGYDMAAAIARESVKTGKTVRAALPREEGTAARRAGSTARRAPHDRSIIGNCSNSFAAVRRRKGAHAPHSPPPPVCDVLHFILRCWLVFRLWVLQVARATWIRRCCPRGSGNGRGGTGGPCDAVPILTAKCGYPGLCHDNRALAPGGLDLMTAPFNRLVGDMPDGTNTLAVRRRHHAVPGRRIEPRDRAAARQADAHAAVRRMMPTLDLLTPTEVTCLQSWATGLTCALTAAPSRRSHAAPPTGSAASEASEKSVTPRASQSASQRCVAAGSATRGPVAANSRTLPSTAV